MASCKQCGKTAEELYGDWSVNMLEGYEPDQYAKQDGTYNRETDLFWCDDCYIKIGMPLGTA